MSLANERQPKRFRSLGNLINDVIIAVGVGALAAGGSATVILALVGVALVIAGPPANWVAVAYILVQSVAVIILASMVGAAAGLLIAIIDHLIGGRLHDGRMPFWVWLPICGALGAAGSVLILVSLLDTEIASLSTGLTALIGGVCGLVAGPVFGWFYRRRAHPGPPSQGVG